MFRDKGGSGTGNICRDLLTGEQGSLFIGEGNTSDFGVGKDFDGPVGKMTGHNHMIIVRIADRVISLSIFRKYRPSVLWPYVILVDTVDGDCEVL